MLAFAHDAHAIGRRLSMMSTAVGLLALVFTAGYNWSRIVELREWRDTHEGESLRLQTVYLRADVATAQLDAIHMELARLRQEITELRRHLEAAP